MSSIINFTVDAEGYVNGFATTGDLSSSQSAIVTEFDTLNYDCYKLVNNELVFDDPKYQKKINPVPNPPTVSLEDYVLDLEFRLAMLEIGGI
ncbi:MAG: hypothetical protein ABS948_11800 [Solibacillus sp.]